MADWNQPTNASAYTGVLSTLNEKITNAAKMDFTGDTNIPTGSVRHDSTTNKFQEWDGSAWVDITVHFGASVGIGTTSPSNTLQVVGSTTISSQANVTVRLGSASTSDLMLGSLNGNAPFIASQGANPLLFITNAIENARLSSAGNFGINQTNPSFRLHIGVGSAIEGAVIDGSSSGTSGGAYWLVRNGGTNVCGIGNYSALFGGSYNATSTLWSNSVGWRVTNMGTGAGTHAMRYDTGTGAWTYDTSSIRYKQDVVECPYGLSAVLALTPRAFKYKESEREDVGFIAEELIQHIPEIVPLDKDGNPDAVNYDRLTAVLCKAIQELHAKVEALVAQQLQ